MPQRIGDSEEKARPMDRTLAKAHEDMKWGRSRNEYIDQTMKVVDFLSFLALKRFTEDREIWKTASDQSHRLLT